MSTYIEYTVEQNATFKAQLQLRADTGDGINLVPYVLTGQVRKAHSSLNVAATITCTKLDASNGILQLSIGYPETANVKPGRYVYDVRANNASTGEAVRLIEGTITFTPAVTKP
jgi:hypothetical protein